MPCFFTNALWHSDNLCLHWSVILPFVLIYSNVHWQLVTFLHDGSFYCFCLLAESSYETINQIHFFGIWRQHNHKDNFCKDLECNAIHTSHQLQTCVKGAVTPDVSCTAEHQSTTIASNRSTIRLNTTKWCQLTFVNCELSRLEMYCCCAYFAVISILVCINIS